MNDKISHIIDDVQVELLLKNGVEIFHGDKMDCVKAQNQNQNSLYCSTVVLQRW